MIDNFTDLNILLREIVEEIVDADFLEDEDDLPVVDFSDEILFRDESGGDEKLAFEFLE